MDFNYTLRYRPFDQLLEDVSIDMNTLALENMIEPQQLIKIAKKINYDLGLRINQTKEVILEVCHGKVKLPDDFYTFNFAFICGEYEEHVGYDGMSGGTNIQEVPYVETPSTVDQCAIPTVNCSTCNHNPCNNTAACEGSVRPVQNYIPGEYDPNNPYGDTCIRPRVFMNCKGDKWELIQIINTGATRKYSRLVPLRMKQSQEIECDCPNLYYNTANQGWIKGGFLFTTFDTGKVYVNYQGAMEDEAGNLLVPDHDLLNDYYEYALKQRLLENLFMNGEDVSARLQLIEQRLKAARNQALSLVNTPNFKELQDMWWTNRRAQYSKYYDMFKSYSPNKAFYGINGSSRLV
tara:strand:+ start:195 stop:1241 length:1047 start_codon:yes stop_codon:yes gene_type:complete